MALQNPARLTAIEGRSTILFEAAAVVQFTELAPYGDATQDICKTANTLLGNDSSITVRALGGMSFDTMVLQSLPEPSSDVTTAESALQDDSILIVLEDQKFAGNLPVIIRTLSTLSMAYVEAKSLAVSLVVK